MAIAIKNLLIHINLTCKAFWQQLTGAQGAATSGEMTEFVFSPPLPAALKVKDSAALFPVRRIYCLGLNYADHAAEMGRDIGLARAEGLLFFGKPADCIFTKAEFPYPSETQDCHFEVELVAALHQGGKDLSLEAARAAIFGYGVGIDMTRRDVQSRAKKAGYPWDMAKGFDFSAPISAIARASQIGHPREGAIWLKQNGAMRQNGDLKNMLSSPEEAIVQLSKQIQLKAGDLVFTGTPPGVGACVRGDVIEAGIDGVGSLTIRVV